MPAKRLKLFSSSVRYSLPFKKYQPNVRINCSPEVNRWSPGGVRESVVSNATMTATPQRITKDWPGNDLSLAMGYREKLEK